MSFQRNNEDFHNIPDVRDGLTELERTILMVLYEAKQEFGDRMIATALIYGRVVERLDVSREEFEHAFSKTVPFAIHCPQDLTL